MRALITGVTGQDGSYLAEHLTARGYEVYGVVRGAQHPRREWLLNTVPGIQLVNADLLDQTSLERALLDVMPDEIYNLAAVTSPGAGWEARQSPLLAEVTALGAMRLLDAALWLAPNVRLVHASSSAVYSPHTYGPYGVAKKFAHDTVVGYRVGHGVHVSNAVLFSHTSPRQSREFLVRKVVRHVVDVAAGRTSALRLHNVHNRRDWGYAPDYVRVLPLIAGAEHPGDYDVLTGVTHSVRDVVDVASATLGITWEQVSRGWDALPELPDRHEIPAIDETRACEELGWKPQTSFRDMIELLVRAELER